MPIGADETTVVAWAWASRVPFLIAIGQELKRGRPVTSISIAVAVAILTFGSGLLGLYPHKQLPQTHLSGDSKDMIPAVTLVIGTLVGNAYAFLRDAGRSSESSVVCARRYGRNFPTVRYSRNLHGRLT